ncbi:hypothetical protein HDV64DRAFT_240062 [Trichoderma sp. TUCIM 5745]
MLLLMRQLCFSLSRVLYCVCSSLNYCPPTSVSPKAQPFHSPYTSQYHWNYNYLAAAQISQQNCMGRFIAVDCRSQVRRALAPFWDIEIPTSKLRAPSSMCWQIASSYRQRQTRDTGLRI